MMLILRALGALTFASLVICAPYTPKGGVEVDTPIYHPASDFDFQSLNLALNQEYIELDLFRRGLAMFSKEDFERQGITGDYQFLIEYMAEQEIGHATLVSNILGPKAAKECEYQYPFQTVPEFIDFCQKLTRWGESGVYGFLAHLDSRPSATLLQQSITTEARQQMVFRQFEGLFPMPVWFEIGITQSMAWTLLAPYISHCPAENPHIEFQNFPALTITNNPNGTHSGSKAAVSTNTTALSVPGRTVYFEWESPGKKVGYDDQYMTSTTAGAPKFVAWISQLNTTFTPLADIKNNCGSTTQPGGTIFGDNSAPTINDTMFVVITDANPYVTPFNLTLLNKHVVAGPAVYQAG